MKAGPVSDNPRALPALPPGHPPVRFGRVGVLLINLGSPSGEDAGSVRRYLREFLSDRRVIEVPRLPWLAILNLFVLTTRPKKTAHAYGLVWNRERNEAPLITITRAQAEKLGAALTGDGVMVDWAMRYGKPAIGERLTAMKDAGCDRILLAPLYPQYSAATTATANDAAFAAMARMRWQPAVRTLPPYFDAPGYIEALAESIRASVAALPFEPEVVLASYHGLPKAYLVKGDPYYCHCEKTTRLLRDALGWPAEKLPVAYQSRFGRAEWLQPYTDVAIAELARKGVRRMAVVMPGFSADCLETLEEIALRGAETFRENGGSDFAAIPCLNDGEPGMRMMESLVRRELSGWM